MDTLLAYLPQDRRAALAAGQALPEHCTGAALVADISGFTPLTEALATALGPRRGGEALTDLINAVYAALIAPVDRQGGSVIGFAGDAITCWFDDAPGGSAVGARGAARAAACARAQQAAMAAFAALPHPAGGDPIRLALKVAVAAGPARRLLVGDPAVQVLEVLAGTTVLRMVAAEHLAAPGEIVVDAATLAADGGEAAAWRPDAAMGERFAVLERGDPLPESAADAPAAPTPPRRAAEAPEALRPWLPEVVYTRLRGGQGEFLTELRPTVACFVRFGGLDYDADPTAGARLDAYIRWVQAVVAGTGGTLIDLTVGDKGSYLYASWGALAAHEDDARRAVTAAQELRHPPAALAFVGPVQIGLSQGVMRTGAVGGPTRRSYTVLGDEVNLTARLMAAAAPGQVLASARVVQATATAFTWAALPALRVKGKREPVDVHALQIAPVPDAIRLPEPRAGGPLVGRAAEMAQIGAVLGRARQGQGQVLGLSGEAGIGKSRLVAETLRTAQADGWAVYGGAAQSTGTRTPYLAWRSIWRGFFGLTPGAALAAHRACVAQVVAAIDPALRDRVPLLGMVLDLPLPDTDLTAGLDEQLRKESREALLIDLLCGRARSRPVLLVVEDAHWLDPLSEDLLEAVGRAIPAVPVALLAVFRPPETARRQVPRLAALPHFTDLPLRRLPPQEVAQLLAGRLAHLLPEDTPVPGAAVARLAARVQGNPFYLEELVNYLAEQGVDPTDPAALAEVELPLSLHSLVLSRVDQLAERQQRTLKVASIIGRRFRAGWLAGYHPALGAVEEVYADLDATTHADLTAPEGAVARRAYLFVHIVTQEVAYNSLAEATRRMLHEQLGAWLERSGSIDLDLLAFHYSRSGHAAKRREYLRRAGDAAAATYSNAAAVDYYERLLAELTDTDPERGDVLVALGDVLERTSAWQEAAVRYQTAINQPAVDPGTRARAQRGLGVVYRDQGAYVAAQPWLAMARATFAAAGDAAGERQALADLGRLYHLQGVYDAARVMLEEVVARAAAAQDLAGRAWGLHSLGAVVCRQGDYPAAQALMEESLALQWARGDQAGIAAGLNGRGLVAMSQGDYPAARALYEEALTQRRVLGARAGIATSLNNLGAVAWRQGDFAAARTLHEESLALFRALGDPMGMAMTLVNLGVVASLSGAVATAQARFGESLVRAHAIGSSRERAWGLLGLVGCAARLGASAAAARWLGRVEQDLAARGEALEPDTARLTEATVAPARAALGATAYAAAYAAGQALTWDEAVAEALAFCAASGIDPGDWVIEDGAR